MLHVHMHSVDFAAVLCQLSVSKLNVMILIWARVWQVHCRAIPLWRK